MKELYLYSGIYDFTAEAVITALEENMGEEVVLRVNSPGGNVFANNGMAAKIGEHGEVTIKVDGCAMSSAANLLLYAKRVECLDVSKFMFHRASMYVSSESDQQFLDGVNKDLRKKMEAKFDATAFKNVTGYTIKELFENETRIDLVIDAKQAKKLGLVQKVNTLTVAEMKALDDRLYAVAATATPAPQTSERQNTNMTLAELKAQHPALVTAIAEEALNAERDRVGALLAYIDIDAATVVPLIKEGKPMTQTLMAEMGLKALSAKSISTIAGEAAPDTATAATAVNTLAEKTPDAKAKELEDFRKKLTAHREKNPS